MRRQTGQPIVAQEKVLFVAPRFQQAVAVAGFAEQLRGSGMGAPSLDDVLAIAQRIAPQLANDADIQEFAQLVERAIELQH